MPAPYCLLCDSTNVVMDESGLFVCADCGARYTVEAMRGIVFPDQQDTKQPGERIVVPVPPVPAEEPLDRRSSDENLIVSHYEAANYKLACSVFDEIVDKENVHAWPLLLALLSDSITNGKRCFPGTSTYGRYRKRAESEGLGPMEKGSQAVAAMFECMLVASAIADSLFESLKSVRSCGIDTVADIPITLNPTKIGVFFDSSLRKSIIRKPRDPQIIGLPSGLDYELGEVVLGISGAIVEAVDYIYECVAHGYVPSKDDWERVELASQLIMGEHMTSCFSFQIESIKRAFSDSWSRMYEIDNEGTLIKEPIQ